jgi:hypothetical protein
MVYRMGVGYGMAVDRSSGRAALHSVTAHHSTHLPAPPEYLSEPSLWLHSVLGGQAFGEFGIPQATLKPPHAIRKPLESHLLGNRY